MNISGCIFSFLIALSLLPFFSCTNRYERQAIGYYEVDSYERMDSSKSDKIDLPVSLTLNGDNTFSLTFKDSMSKGKWEANDDGDRTWITFYYNGEMSSDGDIGDGFINVWNPKDFNCSQLRKLIFKKVNK